MALVHDAGWAESWQQSWDRLEETLMPDRELRIRAWLRDGYENAGLRAEVRVTIDAARQVVGVSAFGADRDLPNDANRGELWVLYVAPSHWGRGYGYALLRDAEEALATTGRRDLELWVLEGNDRARRFYERAGWRGDDGMKPFGDSGLYEVRYRKQV